MNSLSYTWTSLIQGNKYKIKISATNLVGESDYS